MLSMGTKADGVGNLLTVVQAEPLRWRHAETGQYNSIEQLDFRLERDTIQKALSEAKFEIDLVFKSGTADNMSAAITTPNCRSHVLHLSCFGTPWSLLLEDGSRGAHFIDFADIANLIISGSGEELKLVFVSACHSQKLGEELVKMGVPHVLCCEKQTDMESFSRAFYHSLACGKTLQAAFDHGKQAVRHSLLSADSQHNASDYVLLPSDSPTEKYHDVPIFFGSKTIERSLGRVIQGRRVQTLTKGTRAAGAGNWLTVIQAEPLRWRHAETGRCHSINQLDFRLERKTIQKALSDAELKINLGIDIAFESGTAENVSTAITTNGCRSHVLHLSCFGTAWSLLLEDGFRGAHFIDFADIAKLISSGSGEELKLVVISASHSRKVGEELVKMGVPHVLCCEHADDMMDDAVIEFTQAFYRSLACGKTLRIALDHGKQAVRHSPFASDSEHQMVNFVLLPERDNPNDMYHDVPVFFGTTDIDRNLMPILLGQVSQEGSVQTMFGIARERIELFRDGANPSR